MKAGKQQLYHSVKLSPMLVLFCCVVVTNTRGNHNSSWIGGDNKTISMIEGNSQELTPNLPKWVSLFNPL